MENKTINSVIVAGEAPESDDEEDVTVQNKPVSNILLQIVLVGFVKINN